MAPTGGASPGRGGDESPMEKAHSEPRSGELVRVIRGLRALGEARWSLSADRDMRVEERVKELIDALRQTALGQATDARLLARLLPAAEIASLCADTRVELQGSSDALYVVLSGAMEVLRSPSARRLLHITVESGSHLPGDSNKDRLDPYVVVQVGPKKYTGPVAMDAGENAVWNWTVAVVYQGEPRLDFCLMEYDDYSRPDLLGFASVDAATIKADGLETTLTLNSNPTDNERTALLATFGKHGDRRSSVSLHHPGSSRKASTGTLKVKLEWGDASSTASPLINSEPVGLRNSELDVTKAGAARSLSTAPGVYSPTVAADGGGGGEGGGLLLLPSSNSTMYNSKGRSPSMCVSPATAPSSPERGEPPAEMQRTLLAGHFFGLNGGGGLLKASTTCQLLLVPRRVVDDATHQFRADCVRERTEFMMKHLPGAHELDARTFESFTSGFQLESMPQRRVLMQAGESSPSERRVFIIRHGSCKALLQMPAPSITRAPLKRYDEVLKAPERSQSSFMLIGVGSVIGYASALFGLPEPFTVVANEPLSVFAVSLTDRPLASWPKETISRLNEVLRARTDFHVDRRTKVNNSTTLPDPETVGMSRQEAYQVKIPEWQASESRFWRCKEIPAWRTDAIRDMYDVEGWAPPSPSCASCQVRLPSGRAERERGGMFGGISGASTAPNSSWGSRATTPPTPGAALESATGSRPDVSAPPLCAVDRLATSSACASLSASTQTPVASSPKSAAGAAVATVVRLPRPVSPVVGQRPAASGSSPSRPPLSAALAARAASRPSSSANHAGLLRESRSEPSLPSSRPGTVLSASVAASGASTTPSRVGAPTKRGPGAYHLNSGIGRCQTPWGLWNPSGMLPLPKAKRRAQQFAQDDEESSIPGRRRELVPRAGQREVNLACEHDWRHISRAASSSALEKMYKRQVRARCLKDSQIAVAT